jgi:hypothetical protein
MGDKSKNGKKSEEEKLREEVEKKILKGDIDWNKDEDD